jgi:predicted ATPase
MHAGPKGIGRIGLRVEFGPHTYRASLVAAANDQLIFDDERFQTEGYGQYNVLFGRGHGESGLQAEAEKRGPDSAAADVLDTLHGCRVFHFHDTSRNAPVKRFSPSSDNIALRPDGGNLAAFLLQLRRAEPRSYQRILRTLQQVAPFFRDFVLQEEASGQVRLRWRQQDSDIVFPAEALSDGTLRFICLATLLQQPELPGLVLLDEPELGLHPAAIVQLAGMLRSASTRSQALIATQSVTLTNQFGLDELVVVERSDGASVFSRPDPEHLASWLEEYSLGELWEKNVLGGRPKPEMTAPGTPG